MQKNLHNHEKLLHVWYEKPTSIDGFLDDYACLIRACIDLHQCTLNESYLEQALQLTELTLRDFGDEQPFFCYTSARAEQLIVRKKEIFDNVIPSSNSVMSNNLLTLGRLLGRNDLQERALVMLKEIAALSQEEPVYMSNWGMALLDLQARSCEVVIRGNDALRGQLQQHYHPFVLYAQAASAGMVPFAQGKLSHEYPAIFVCPNHSCLEPVANAKTALQLLSRHAQGFRSEFN